MKSIPYTIGRFNLSARLCRLLAIVSLAASAVATRAEIDMFLRLVSENTTAPNIPGTSEDPLFKGENGWFEIKGFTIKVENSTTIGSASGGAGTGKATFVDFSLAKAVDPASPLIFKTLAAGGHWKYAQLYVRRPGATTGKPFLVYNFNLVFTTNQEWIGAAAESVLTENVRFAYGALQISVLPQNAVESTRPISASWSQLKNTEEFDAPPAD